MKKICIFLVIIALYSGNIIAQEFDLTFAGSETGTQSHIARNSVTLGPGYTYTPGGGTMSIEIQNPVVTGSIAYNATPVDPQSRTLNTSYLVGATNGSLNVNAMGGATYTIPIEVLPGLNGLSPNLSLTYSSNSGPGLAGYGWNISGLSAVSRGPKTYYHDGTAKGISLDTTDRFYIDGQRLVTTNSYAYGNALAEYQTDNDIFTRVKQYGTDAYGPAYFKAETKAGIIFEYGNSIGSKQKISGFQQVVNWYVSKVSDLFGNQINISYLQDNYNVYPAEITYGPNTITFYYKERSDISSSYFKGTQLQQRILLEKITVKYNSNIVKSYEFKYNSIGALNAYSLLNEVIEYGIGTSRINSTAFTYYSPDGVSFQLAVDNGSDTDISSNSRLFPGDYNGDGRTDIFCLPSSGGFRCYLSGFSPAFYLADYGDFSINETSIQTLDALDLNGDNADDIVFSIQEQYYYALSNQGDFGNCINFASGGNFFAYRLFKKNSGDIDGDGFDDFLILSPNGAIRIYSFAYENGQISPMALRYSFNLGTSVSLSEKIYLIDFNGDGKADLWKVNSSGLKIYSLNGSSMVEIYSGTSPTTGDYYTFGDFNGDGKADVLEYGSSFDYFNWRMKHSTGTSFETFNIPRLKANLRNDVVRVGDFNGDGCSDLSVLSSDNSWNGHYYYLSKNQGTELLSYFYSAGPSSSWKYHPGDYNGDGRYDFLCTWTVGYRVYNSPGKRSYLMEKIGNGLGTYARITYFQLSEVASSLYERGTGASFPVTDYQGAISVVDMIQYDNGRGSMNNQSYYYKGLKIHKQGKGIIGFSGITIHDAANNILSESTYDYDPVYFYPRLISSTKKQVGYSSYFETQFYSWSHKILNASRKRIFPFIQSTTQTNKLTGDSVTITLDYDNYGNPTSITKTYSNGISTNTTQVYNNTISSTKWLLGRPTSINIQYSGNGSTITRSGTRVFNANNNTLTNETWHNNTTVAVKNSYEYNTNGTLKKQTVTDLYRNISRSMEFTYEASNGIRVATVRDPLLHTTTNTYDSYGRLYRQQDYLANQVTYTYDNMHRQLSVTRSDGSGASTTYAWENPASTPLLARYSIKTDGLDGSQTKVWYDKLGREIRSDVKGFDGTMVHNDIEYDIKGQVYRISEPYNSGSAVWNTFTYDNYGRKTGLTTPSGSNSTWQYSGNTVTETTAGKTYTKTFAADGTVIAATDAGGTINYAYYPDGQLKTVTAPGNITTQMEYDIAGNQKKLIDPSAGTMVYTNNSFGELLTQKNARNQKDSLTYLSDGRLQQKITPEGTTTYTYNTSENFLQVALVATEADGVR
ncbi:MAG: FG-GAP-like repeat-containing protein, partial [Ignavibacteriaceae bacterium]